MLWCRQKYKYKYVNAHNNYSYLHENFKEEKMQHQTTQRKHPTSKNDRNLQVLTVTNQTRQSVTKIYRREAEEANRNTKEDGYLKMLSTKANEKEKFLVVEAICKFPHVTEVCYEKSRFRQS